MHPFASFNPLDSREEEAIHRNVLRILDEVGFRVENEALLARLADVGGRVDRQRSLAKFPPELVERFLDESEPFAWDEVTPAVSASADVYLGAYLDPLSDQFVPWDLDRLRSYVKLAHYLEHVSVGGLLGCPLADVPKAVHPLHQRYLCWKLGLGVGGSLWDVGLAPYLLEMGEVMAAATGRDTRDFFSGAVYLQSPLQFGRAEAEQYVWFADRGYRVGVGLMMSCGGTGPATLAGAVSLQLAELICLHILQRAYWGDRHLHLYCSLTPLDMQRGMYPYGRSERPLAALAMAQMARRYRASFAGHGGHSDAKRPSHEAGAQKVLTCLPLLMASGRAHVAAGLLSVDEVFSPIQMILDDELTAALQRFARGFEITDDTLAFDEISAVGPGGCFTQTDHTLRHFRGEHWQPALWSREMRRAWQQAGARTDVERAREVYRDLMTRPDLPPQIDDETERALLAVIRRAER
jgi:trimethylamine--corrinoid protein Co-methyltransferase